MTLEKRNSLTADFSDPCEKLRVLFLNYTFVFQEYQRQTRTVRRRVCRNRYFHLGGKRSTFSALVFFYSTKNNILCRLFNSQLSSSVITISTQIDLEMISCPSSLVLYDEFVSFQTALLFLLKGSLQKTIKQLFFKVQRHWIISILLQYIMLL